MAPPQVTESSSMSVHASEATFLVGSNGGSSSSGGGKYKGYQGGDQEMGGGEEKRGIQSPSHKGTVGMLGGIAIAANTLTGPGMLELPATYQRSGFIPTTVVILLVCTLSSMCALNMAHVISKVPGNSNFAMEIEYSEAFRIFWGRKWFVATQVAFSVCILCQLLASIVDTAQVVDQYMGGTDFTADAMSVQFYPGPARWVTWNKDSCGGGGGGVSQTLHLGDNATTAPDDVFYAIENRMPIGGCIAFGRETDGSLILTGGYVISALLFLPLGLLDLKENVLWQIIGFIFLLVFSFQFIWAFVTGGLDTDNLSLWGHSWSHLFGIVMFNFTVVTAVPAWLYEKKPSICVPTVIHSSSALASVLYILVGSLGALSIPRVSENMLSSMITGSFGPFLQTGAFLFAFFIIGLGIPLFSVLLRLNLTGSGLCSQRTGHVISGILPWVMSWTLYRGDGVKNLLAWGGVLGVCLVVFIFPLQLARHTVWEIDAVGLLGSVSVWGGLIKSKEGEKKALRILLSVSILAVFLSLGGLFLNQIQKGGK